MEINIMQYEKAHFNNKQSSMLTSCINRLVFERLLLPTPDPQLVIQEARAALQDVVDPT